MPAQARPWLRVHGSNSRGELVLGDAAAGVGDGDPELARRPRSASIRATPRSVYLTALEARLRTIWRTRAASPCSASGTRGVDVHAQLERAAAQARAQHAGDRGQQPARVVVGGLGLGAAGLGAR